MASMRPQRNAAENAGAVPTVASVYHASMRPQRNAAENVCSGIWASKPVGCFNEAAA